MLVLAALGMALAEEPTEEIPSRLDITGVGEVYVAPDEAVLTLGVRSDAETAGAAFEGAAEAMQGVVAAVGALVPEERIRTSYLSLEPRYDYTTDRARLIGYQAAATLQIRIDDPMAVGSVLDAAVAAGANEVAGIAWVIEDDAAVRAEALDAAVADALTNAEQVAADLGVVLGAPLQVYVGTQGGGIPPMLYDRSMADEDGGYEMPVLGGEQVYRAEVTVSFRIEAAAPGT